MEKVRFYEGLFFEVVMLMLKDKKKYIIKETMSIKVNYALHEVDNSNVTSSF